MLKVWSLQMAGAAALGWAPARGPARGAANDARAGITPSWNWVPYGAYIGSKGLVSAQVNGRTEVYASASIERFGPHPYWHTLTPVSGKLGDGLEQVFASEPFASDMVALTLAKAAGGH